GHSCRSLLLLSPTSNTNHVVAEVHVNGRWVVVDPSFRVILKDASGNLLTREQLADPTTFLAATRGLAHYDPQYAYTRTEHIHLTTLPIAGVLLQRVLDSWFPQLGRID